MASSSVADRVQAIAERVAIDHGLELVHAEVAGPDNKPIVRIFIDKPNGVTHQDCSEVSLHVGTVLDVEDFIHASYTLEVSSPGIERGLYKLQDYERFAGSLAKLKTLTPNSTAGRSIAYPPGRKSRFSLDARNSYNYKGEVAKGDCGRGRITTLWAKRSLARRSRCKGQRERLDQLQRPES